MDTTSPVATDAIRQLRINLYEHLDEAEGHATKNSRWSEEDIETARRLIPDLVTRDELYQRLHAQRSDLPRRLSEFEREVIFRRSAMDIAAQGTPAPAPQCVIEG